MKKKLLILICVLVFSLLITGCGKTVYSGTTETKNQTTQTQAKENKKQGETIVYKAKDTTPLLSIDDIKEKGKTKVDKDYQEQDVKAGETVAILHTSMGDISMKFFKDVAPIAVENFIQLAKAGRFDNTIFHRVINNFMIQGGDYTNFNGTGGASAFGDEFDLEICENISNIEGSVAMANRGPGTNGSQFYINQVDNQYLDGNYTVFGQVYDGLEVVNDIANVSTDSSDKPLQDVILFNIDIEEYKD